MQNIARCSSNSSATNASGVGRALSWMVLVNRARYFHFNGNWLAMYSPFATIFTTSKYPSNGNIAFTEQAVRGGGGCCCCVVGSIVVVFLFLLHSLLLCCDEMILDY